MSLSGPRTGKHRHHQRAYEETRRNPLDPGLYDRNYTREDELDRAARRAAEEDEQIRRYRKAGVGTNRGLQQKFPRPPKGDEAGKFCLIHRRPQFHWNTDAFVGMKTEVVRCFQKRRDGLKWLKKMRNAEHHLSEDEYDLVPRHTMRKWRAKSRQYPRGRQKSGLPRAEEFMRVPSPDDLPF